MADEDLKARLYEHSKAFEGLMALVPAELYYGKDNSDQWQKQQKKQTPEERRAAKKAKLEPGAYKTALDVHKEREQEHMKRKREAEGIVEEDATKVVERTDDTEEQPSKKQKKEKVKLTKNKKTPAETPEQDEAIRQEKAAKRREANKRKKERSREAHQRQKEKQKERKQHIKELKRAEKKGGKTESEAAQQDNAPSKKKIKAQKKQAQEPKQPVEPSDSEGSASEIEFEAFGDDDDASSAGSSPEQEAIFDSTTNHSSASSSSSVVPPSNLSEALPKPKAEAPTPQKKQQKPQQRPQTTVPTNIKQKEQDNTNDSEASSSDDEEQLNSVALPNEPEAEPTPSQPTSSSKPGDELKPNSAYLTTTNPQPPPNNEPADTTQPHTPLPKIDREALTKRLADKLAALRTARKADGPDGRPAKSRTELLEARRKKSDLKRQRKKEARAKEQEAKDAETEAARLRGGDGSPIWSPSMYSPGGALAQQDNLAFGKVAFDGGDGKKKGPSDVKTALLAAEKKKARLAGYDAEKRANIAEKDAWAQARQRVEGGKMKDDEKLLKKTLKRKEKQKGRSEKAWNERIEGVEKGKEMRQRKREENLRKRKEEKGVKGKDRKKLAAKKGGGVVKGKPKKRPGFEGTFKTGAARR